MKDIEDENKMPNDRRLVLLLDKNGNAGWGDADIEKSAHIRTNQRLKVGMAVQV